MTRIAALQMVAAEGDVEKNLATIERAASEAAAKGAALMVTPELAVTGYGAGDAIVKLAEPEGAALQQRLAAIAGKSGVALVVGFAERDGGAVHNSALFTDGVRTVVYRKSHLYGAYERGLFEPGEPVAAMFEHAGMTFGMLIYYDVEFPENVRRLARSGVQAVLVPTALPASGHDTLIARKMIPVRAFENQIFVAYVDHAGRDSRFAYAGLSGIAAPDGTMLAEAGAAGEALLVADLVPADYAASAAANTYLADLREG